MKRTPARIRALNIARREVGVHEVGFHNRGKRVDEYERADNLPGVGYAWCMAFVQWSYRRAGHPLPNMTASVGTFLSWARGIGWVVQRPARGDLVCFNFDSDEWPDHVGFVLWRIPGGFIRTLEGNTSPSAAGSQADGGGVYRRVRSTRRCAFVRVPGY